MANGQPPQLAPEVLFRRMLEWRPSEEISCLSGNARVQGITALQELAIIDRALAAPKEVQEHRLLCGLIAACVRSDGDLLFATPEDVGELYEDEIGKIGEAVTGALERVSPSYVRSDWREWKRVLLAGARHASNAHIAYTLSACFDPVAMSERVIPRPERFWNAAPVDLLDCHYMAFRAARTVYG